MQHTILSDMLASKRQGVLCLARVDHADSLQVSGQLEEFPAEALQSAFLERLASQLPASTAINSMALGEFCWWLEKDCVCNPIFESILTAFRAPFDYGQYTAFVTLSICHTTTDTDTDEETCITQLDLSLRNAQAQGGDRCYVARAARNVLSQLPSAIEREEFSIHFQGLWSISNQQLVGAEALLRWHGLDINNIDPAQLIRMAEQGGKISSLGNWIVNKACVHASTWLENWKSPLRLGLNVSGQQFHSANFVSFVTDCLERTWLSANLLCIEIKYIEFMDLLAHHSQALSKLKKLGVQLCLDGIDDEFFGEQYAELRAALLGEKAFIAEISSGLTLNVQELKFSPRMITQLSDPRVKEIGMEQIAQFVESLNKERIRSVAVGVENDELLQTVSKMGFEFAQGYLLAKPMSAADFNRFARTSMR